MQCNPRWCEPMTQAAGGGCDGWMSRGGGNRQAGMEVAAHNRQRGGAVSEGRSDQSPSPSSPSPLSLRHPMRCDVVMCCDAVAVSSRRLREVASASALPLPPAADIQRAPGPLALRSARAALCSALPSASLSLSLSLFFCEVVPCWWVCQPGSGGGGGGGSGSGGHAEHGQTEVCTGPCEGRQSRLASGEPLSLTFQPLFSRPTRGQSDNWTDNTNCHNDQRRQP